MRSKHHIASGANAFARSRLFLSLCVGLVFGLMLTAARGESAAVSDAAVYVEEVTPGQAAGRAGLMPGDRLTGWRRVIGEEAEDLHSFVSPFDVIVVEMEHAPRTNITIIGERAGQDLSLMLPHGRWGITVRPALSADRFELYRRGHELSSQADTQNAVDVWSELAGLLERDNDPATAAWIRLKLYGVDENSERREQAFQRARAAVSDAEPTSPILPVLWELRAKAAEKRADTATAEDAWLQSIQTRESFGEDSLALAHDFYMLGTLRGRVGDLETSGGSLNRALEIIRRLAPGSLPEADALSGLGIGAAIRGDLDGAANLFTEAVQITREIAPESGAMAAALNNLGNVAQRRGDFLEANGYYEQAFSLNQALDPNGLNVAISLNNLGFIAEMRGDLASAESYYRQSVQIKREQAPGSIHVARGIANLAYVAFARGELDRADDIHREALAMYEQLAPGSLVVSTSLKLLGEVNLERDVFDVAANFFAQARELEERIAPNTLSFAEIIDGLGRVEEARGEITAARAYYEQALDIIRAVAPATLPMASQFGNLGRLAAAERDFDTAQRLHRQALSMRSRLAPGTEAAASSHFALASIERAIGEPIAASAHYEAALDALEAQTGKLGGGSESQSRFASKYGHYYKEFIDLLVDSGDAAYAFNVLERYRARSLLQMLAERDLLLDQDLPDLLVAERSSLNKDYDRVYSRLNAAGDTDEHASEIDGLLSQLLKLQEQRQSIAERVREASPRLASARYPQALTVAEAAEQLGVGTTLLSFAVTDEETLLFVLNGGAPDSADLTVFTIPLGREALSSDVAALRLLLQVPGAGAASRDALIERSHSLYRALIGRADGRLSGTQRLLIVPDGPLHRLPFAALVTRVETQDGGPKPRYLVERHSIDIAISVTAYAEVGDENVANRERASVAAFGDPNYATPTSEALESDAVSMTAARGGALQRLPLSRREVEGIGRLFSGSAKLYLGEAASEDEAKSIDRQTQYVHFASHGVLDERSPLDSFLAMSMPIEKAQRENGLLQAWEIFEQLRINADLVTLSACATGLGEEIGGEGLLGLTRAFQYAGAKSVLASLWAVSDHSTGALMLRFYEHLKAGERKDDALRKAQLELIRDPIDVPVSNTDQSWWKSLLGKFVSPMTVDAAHPYYWAAFQLYGDAS